MSSEVMETVSEPGEALTNDDLRKVLNKIREFNRIGGVNQARLETETKLDLDQVRLAIQILCGKGLVMKEGRYYHCTERGEKALDDPEYWDDYQGIECPDCGREFKNEHGLNVHRFHCKAANGRKDHPTAEEQDPPAAEDVIHTEDTGQEDQVIHEPEESHHEAPLRVESRIDDLETSDLEKARLSLDLPRRVTDLQEELEGYKKRTTELQNEICRLAIELGGLRKTEKHLNEYIDTQFKEEKLSSFLKVERIVRMADELVEQHGLQVNILIKDRDHDLRIEYTRDPKPRREEAS